MNRGHDSVDSKRFRLLDQKDIYNFSETNFNNNSGVKMKRNNNVHK